MNTSERRTCSVIGITRSSFRYQLAPKDNEEELRLAMIKLAKRYGRYGYRKIAALLRMEGYTVNHKKVERLWREEGLQLPKRHKKRRRLYHKDSSVIRLRPLHKNHISLSLFAAQLPAGQWERGLCSRQAQLWPIL